jgi:hypothetical protein
MSIFSKHKLELSALFREIPDEELNKLSDQTHVDYCSKVLRGKLIFYLLLYGILKVDRFSQRGLSDAFSSPFFRTIFNYRGRKNISHSSISDRLSVINIDFFRKSYECIYQRFSSLYTKKEIAGMNLQRVDSTLVVESSNKLEAGLKCHNIYKNKNKKQIKYTFAFDGMFASFVQVHKDPHYTSESIALPENVLSHFKKVKDHAQVYILDKGQQSAEAFETMNHVPELLFVGRLQENRRYILVQDKDIESTDFQQGKLIRDALVKIYKRENHISKNGKETHKSVLIEDLFRIICFQPEGKDEMTLITNLKDMPADEIACIYRRRWDIEVFFRFIKQELNFSHFLSMNENGIQVVLYMTLITAMLIMIYKKENEIGYKTAVRRMGIELESLVMAIIVIQSGGDLRKTDLPAP